MRRSSLVAAALAFMSMALGAYFSIPDKHAPVQTPSIHCKHVVRHGDLYLEDCWKEYK